MSNRACESWIDSFLEYTKLKPTSEVFRMWSGFSTVASALQRRCYCRINDMRLFPNLYVVLIGGPGSGKSVAINCAREFAGAYRFNKYVGLAADSTTRESFFQQMEKTSPEVLWIKTPENLGTIADMIGHLDESPMSVMSAELGSLLGTKNIEFIRALADLFDTDRKEFKYLVKNSASSIIKGPWLNLLAGTTPLDLGEILPRQAANQGFTSRLVLIWSSANYKSDDLFARVGYKADLEKNLMDDYEMMLEMFGEFLFDNDAADLLNDWNLNREKTDPSDPILTHYRTRRLVHLTKLAMVIAASRRQEMVITLKDMTDSMNYLQEVEKDMHHCLQASGGNENIDVLPMALEYVYTEFNRKGGKPVPQKDLRRFIHRFVKVHEISHYISMVKDYCLVEGEAGAEFYSPVKHNIDRIQ